MYPTPRTVLMRSSPSARAGELPAHLPDVDVDAPVERIERPAEHPLADVLARDDTPGCREQHVQQIEFDRRELDGAASFMTVRVAGSSVTSPTVTARLLVLLARLDAAENGVNARCQLARVERLGQVVIGADLQADNAIDVFAAGGEQDDGNRGSPSKRRAEFRSRSARAASHRE